MVEIIFLNVLRDLTGVLHSFQRTTKVKFFWMDKFSRTIALAEGCSPIPE